MSSESAADAEEGQAADDDGEARSSEAEEPSAPGVLDVHAAENVDEEREPDVDLIATPEGEEQSREAAEVEDVAASASSQVALAEDVDQAPEAVAAGTAGMAPPWVSAEKLYSHPLPPDKYALEDAEPTDETALEQVLPRESGQPPLEQETAAQREQEMAAQQESEQELHAESEPEPLAIFEPVQEPAFRADQERSEQQKPIAATATASAAPAAAAPTAAFAVAPPSEPRTPRAKPSSASRPPRRQSRRPVHERFGREAIGIAVLLVLALVCAGLITAVVIKTRNDVAIAAREAANYTPPPLVTPEPTKTGPVIAVIGDGSTSTAGAGVTAKQRWTSLLESSLGGTVNIDATSGMGYAAKSKSGDTFVQKASKVPSNAKVVVFFGGAADSNIASLSLAKAATDACATAKKQAPDAKVLVVGPAISSGVGTNELTAIRDTLRSAAAVVEARWVDPIDKGWLPARRQSSSPGDLFASDEKAIASKMQDAVKKALG
jgi:hypothetical protein